MKRRIKKQLKRDTREGAEYRRTCVPRLVRLDLLANLSASTFFLNVFDP